MAQTFSNEMSGVSSTPVIKPQATAGYGARERVFRATIALASQASGDTIVVCDLAAGYLFARAQITTSVTPGGPARSMRGAPRAGRLRGLLNTPPEGVGGAVLTEARPCGPAVRPREASRLSRSGRLPWFGSVALFI